MIISTSKRFIFTRNVRTASTSLAEVLRRYARPSERWLVSRVARRLPGLRDHWRFAAFSARPHLPLAFAKEVVPHEVFHRSYKFAVVREPFRRMRSIYRHQEMRGRLPRSVNTFSDFMLYWTETRPFLQALQVIDKDGSVLTDEVGRFECLDEYFRHIVRKLNMDEALKLGRMNGTRRAGVGVGAGKRERALVERLCELDYELFDFDTARDPVVTVRTRSRDRERLAKIWHECGGSEMSPWASVPGRVWTEGEASGPNVGGP